MFWWHCGNVEGKRLLVVCMKGTFDVYLFVADGWLIFFSHQPILNLVEILFSYHHMVSNISALTSTTSTTTTMTMTMISITIVWLEAQDVSQAISMFSYLKFSFFYLFII